MILHAFIVFHSYHFLHCYIVAASVYVSVIQRASSLKRWACVVGMPYTIMAGNIMYTKRVRKARIQGGQNNFLRQLYRIPRWSVVSLIVSSGGGEWRSPSCFIYVRSLAPCKQRLTHEHGDLRYSRSECCTILFRLLTVVSLRKRGHFDWPSSRLGYLVGPYLESGAREGIRASKQGSKQGGGAHDCYPQTKVSDLVTS